MVQYNKFKRMNPFIHSDWQDVVDVKVKTDHVNFLNNCVRIWQNVDVIMVHITGQLTFNTSAPSTITHVDIESPFPPPVKQVQVTTMMMREIFDSDTPLFSHALCQCFEKTIRIINFPFYSDSTYDVNVQFFFKRI